MIRVIFLSFFSCVDLQPASLTFPFFDRLDLVYHCMEGVGNLVALALFLSL